MHKRNFVFRLDTTNWSNEFCTNTKIFIDTTPTNFIDIITEGHNEVSQKRSESTLEKYERVRRQSSLKYVFFFTRTAS